MIPFTYISKTERRTLLLMDTSMCSKNTYPWMWIQRKIHINLRTPVVSEARERGGRFKHICKLFRKICEVVSMAQS